MKSDSAVTELVNSLRCRSGFSLGLQETWRCGKENFEEDGFTFLGSGPDTQQGRGSCGVGLLLSPAATTAWRAAGPDNLHNDLGPRVIAARMLVNDPASGDDLGIFQISAYAPTSDSSDDDITCFETALARAIAHRAPKDILVICADSNASIGCENSDKTDDCAHRAIGPFGIPHINQAGRRLRTFLDLHNLVALSSFFKKKHYGTWQHPRSKQQHQLDHIFVSGKDFTRFTNAGSCRFGQLIDSDHRSVSCCLRFAPHLRKKRDARARLTRLDYTPLLIYDIKQSFADKVVSMLGTSDPSATSFTQLTTALTQTALNVLPKRTRAAPPWFMASEELLHTAIQRRNAAFNRAHLEPTPKHRSEYADARKAAQNAVRTAKSAWIRDKCDLVNNGFDSAACGKDAWDTVKLLKAGLTPARRPPPARMRREDGTITVTPIEGAEVFASHFNQLYGRTPSFDPTVLDLLDQEPVFPDIDGLPTDDEIAKGISRLHATSPGASGTHARLWQALASTSAGFDYIRHFITHFWVTENPPVEWETGLLSILPKKGDLSKPGNYRGIMMLEVGYKILGIILLARLKPVKESAALDHEFQNGFRCLRGTIDSVFTVKQLIKKRSEHGLPTWLLLIDLVKAFDRVPRELLWEVMIKQGVPPKLVSLLRSLHTTVKVKFEHEGVTQTLDSIIGVKQGDLLGPDLFTFFMAAVMKTWRSSYSYSLCCVNTKADFQLTGHKPTDKGIESSVPDSEYADDTAFLFESRADCQRMTPLMVEHFDKWGLEVHVGSDTNPKSKSEVLFCAADPRCYTNRTTFDGEDLSPIRWEGGFHMPVVADFKYLGSQLCRTSTDTLDVSSRIESAAKAFGALRKCLFASNNISAAAKRAVYVSVILAILLYGCECWSLTEKLVSRLRVFHNQCVRTMCRVTRKHTWSHRISDETLRQRLHLHPVEFYIYGRQLCWLGNVARMDMSRLPRRMLSSWVRNKRPVGRPRLTYGATVKKALKRFNLTEDRTGFPWHTLACDRGLWKSLICPDSFYNRVSRSDIAEKVNNPHTHTTPANNGSI